MVLSDAVHGRLANLRQLVKTKEVPVKGAADTRQIRMAIEQAQVLPLSRGVFGLAETKRHAAVCPFCREGARLWCARGLLCREGGPVWCARVLSGGGGGCGARAPC